VETSLETFQQEEQPDIQPQAAVEEEDINWRRFGLDLLETLILAVVLFVGINAVSARVRVDGTSMVPTLQDGEFVLVNKLSYKIGDVSRGDIIVFHYPVNPQEDLIKRVMGLPGDHVKVQDGQVYVNDIMLNESYIAARPTYAGEWQVPEDSYFVLGDNRNNSSDSHSWGLLPSEKIVGKAVVIYWPPPFWKILQHPDILAVQ
jgi:signal peptidase I